MTERDRGSSRRKIGAARSRRDVLTAIGGTALSAALAGCGGVGGDRGSEWVRVDAPTEATLRDVVTAADGTYAVGEDGILLRRGDDGWSVVFDGGPAGAENGLRSAAVTSNGRAVWFAGDSGALGLYDVVAERVADFSAPEGRTSSWEAIGVGGLAGSERAVLVNSPGAFVRGRRDGADIEWTDLPAPGSGASVAAMDVTPLSYVYVCDTTGGVYESPDAGASWERIGIEGASVVFEDIVAIDAGHVDVAGGNGALFRYDGVGWERTTVGEQPIRALARDRHDALAVAAEERIYERTFDGWIDFDVAPVGDELLAIALGTPRTPQIAVGESGAILERRY